MENPVTVLSATSGLHNRVDPFRARFDARTRTRALVECDGIVVGENGRVNRAPGRRLLAAGIAHSLAGFGDFGLCVHNGHLARVDAAGNIERLKVLADWGRPMSFAAVATGTRLSVYWTNRSERGVVADGVARPWERTPYPGGEDTDRSFTGPPPCDLIHYHSGRMFAADGNTVWFSEPYSLGCFAPATNRMHFHGAVGFMGGVDGGLWVSDAAGIVYLDGAISPASGEMPRMRRKCSYPVTRGASTAVDVDNFLFEGMTGRGWLVWTDDGVCLLGPGGFFFNITRQDVELRDTDRSPLHGAFGCAAQVGGVTFMGVFDHGV